MTTGNIAATFISASEQYPRHTALIHDGRRLTYNELMQEVTGAAGYYQHKGIRAGSKVLVLLPMTIDLYRIVLALIYMGAVPVFLDAWAGAARLKECCDTVPCDAIITGGKIKLLSFFISALRRIPIKLSTGYQHKSYAIPLMYQPVPDDTALITFTTGSTGKPKAANRTHAFLHAQLKALTPLLPAGPEVSLTTLPIVVLINLALGKTTVLPPEKFKIAHPETIDLLVAALKNNKVTTIVVSPSVMERLTLYSIHHITHIVTGGGPVFPLLAGDIAIKYPQADATIVYGSTEAEPISYISAAVAGNTSLEELNAYGLPVGAPDPGITIAIIPFKTGPVPRQTAAGWQKLQCMPGQAGEIVVTGEHVLKHYVNDPGAEAEQKVNVDGVIWHRTGDAGRMLQDGQLFFLGRTTEVIEWKGKAVYPVIATNCFKFKSRVPDAALLLYKDKLTLVIEKDVRLSDQQKNGALEDAAIPDAVIKRVKQIPKDPRHHTKIDYPQLMKMLSRN